MPLLNGSPQAVPLGGGYRIRAPGIHGEAQLEVARSAAASTRADQALDPLDAALEATNVTEVRQVDVRLEPVQPPTEAGRALRSSEGQELLELEVPDLGPETGQVVLAYDETGVRTWHLPVAEVPAAEGTVSRGAGAVRRFRIPASQPRSAAPEDSGQRSVLGLMGRKVLKVLVYPLLDPIIGALSETFAERWEARYRPYGLRSFSPADRRTPGVGALGPGDWNRLTGGRVLLFVHGTFSTAHGAFEQLPDDVFAELYRRYGERVIAFNHFTLSHDPRQNVDWLLQHIPSDRNLEVDIVCHSRGGLLARTLAQQPSVFHLDTSRLTVKRIVFVGVPNQGTVLAHPDHMVHMIDRFTTALNLFPTGAITETLEALITAIKVMGHGALNGLAGLASMRPDGSFLRALNQGSGTHVEYHAIAADYEPAALGLKAFLTGSVADAVIDRVFERVANDLVVPEPGVYGSNGCEGFPIPATHLLKVGSAAGVVHTTLFGHPPVAERLVDWLQ